MTAAPAPTPRTYTASEVTALTGCSYRQLDYICRGLLDPPDVGTWRTGSGNGRRFTQDDLDLIHATVSLTAAGYGVRAAYDLAKQLTTTGHVTERAGQIYVIRITVEDAE